ncbi:MAG TPA: hypothetical protein VFW66_11445 [Gemmatimonadales bacterium]|nr:hypothetical protein [Gemmatimonadales bacterium]
MNGLASQVSGWFFVAAAALTWLGWFLLPAKPGAFFAADDFTRIRTRYSAWIWLYRFHIFGYVITLMAAAALAVRIDGAARALAWPGLAVLAAGALVSALGAAFYYHMGAWGAMDVGKQTGNAASAFLPPLQVATHYATCLVRFGRVFFGLGQVVLAAGLIVDGTLPLWIAVAAAVLGLAAMGVTMLLPDELERYRPIFHLNAAWMAALGIVLLLAGSGAGT